MLRCWLPLHNVARNITHKLSTDELIQFIFISQWWLWYCFLGKIKAVENNRWQVLIELITVPVLYKRYRCAIAKVRYRKNLMNHGIRIILLVPSSSQTPICYALHSFVLHLAPAVSVLLLLKFRTLSLRLFEGVPAMILSASNSRPTTSSRPSNPLSASSLVPQIRLWLTIVRVYKLYLLTYLLTKESYWYHHHHHHHRLLHQVKTYKITKQMKYKMQMEQAKS